MSQIPEDTIPDEVSALVLDAASALPAGDYGLERVAHRRRSQRRRTAAALSLLGVAVLAAATAIPLAFGATSAEPVGTASASVQRLYYYVPMSPGGKQVELQAVSPAGRPGTTILVPTGITELDERGERVRHVDFGRGALVRDVSGLPGGGFVALDGRDPQPRDSNVGDNVYVLSVVAPDGTVRVSRILGMLDGAVIELVGTTAAEAYLLRDGQLVRHDLATGEERPAAAAAAVAELLGQGWSVDSVGADRIVLVRYAPEGGGQLTVLDLSGKRETTAALGCAMRPDWVLGLKLSPDGRHFACYAAGPADRGPPPGRLVVTDLDTGRQAISRDFMGVMAASTVVAWADDHTLRVARFTIPNKPGEFHLIDLAKVDTFTI